MKHCLPLSILLVAIAYSFHPLKSVADEVPEFRPPAVPLIACDPYFSVWSQANKLWETETTHWTGKTQRLGAIVRVDGDAYRLMGQSPQTVAAMEQVSLQVLPTRSIYQFAGHGVDVTLTFMTPALPEDMMILSRPTTYVELDVKANDNKSHEVEFYFDAGGELATNVLDQKVLGKTEQFENSVAQKMGTESQDILGRSGDDLRIDWGHLYVAAAKDFSPVTAFGDAAELRGSFGKSGIKGLEAGSVNFPVEAGSVVASVAMSLGKVETETISKYVLVAYDDLYSIEYMKKDLRPYWRKDGWQAEDLITAAIDEHDQLKSKCEAFDGQLMNDCIAMGGQEYANICALAYRQCLAAGKFVADENGQPLQFSKENHSNGCIATSDVFYPMMPQFFLFGPSMTKSVLVPFMEYAASDRWKFPFAPHDLGTYPKANGQRYGGGETSEKNQMPVEESGNMLAIFAVLAKMEGNADFAKRYWPQLSQWAKYLKEKGFDPENQLSTDDFAGHLAHNVNLSVKAIVGLGCYAMLCEMNGHIEEAKEYRDVARQYAKQWVKTARVDDHFVLAFDRPDTWSQKYNLVWDRILDLGLFPDEVVETEMAFYRKVQNKYGLPLDSRSDYTKLDWVMWTATLTENREDFNALMLPVHRFLNKTPQRTPMTDWYFTSTARKVSFDARPVVGAVFLKFMYDKDIWNKYASKDKTQASGWAEMPIPPETVTLVPTSAETKTSYHYVTEEPSGEWYGSDYSVSQWKEAPGAWELRGLARPAGPRPKSGSVATSK